MGALINLQGKLFGKWHVISRASAPVSSWQCRCECGTERVVRAQHLRAGTSTCCGCTNARHKKHGEAATGGSFSKKYRTWRQIKRRCCGKSSLPAYRGLLCDAWQEYASFAEYMPDPPSNEHTIDRIENTKGYEPGNVRWATFAEQHRNQSNCRPITFNGKTLLLTGLSC